MVVLSGGEEEIKSKGLIRERKGMGMEKKMKGK
jgi:hypothetical protein